MLTSPTKKVINQYNFNKFSYSKIDHFEYFNKNKIDQIIYKRELNSEECDISKYQNMLVYSYVTDNLVPGSVLLEIGNINSQVSKILNSKGYSCWRLGFKFIFSEKKSNKDVKIEWELKNEKGEKVENFPEEFFDFSFSISAFVKLPENADTFKLFIDKIKSLLKPLKFSLYCFLSIENKVNQVWHNQFMNYLSENVNTINKPISYSTITADKNIFIMSESYFNTHWKISDDMTYEDNGKLFSLSVLWQLNDILLKNHFQDFTYSKKTHFDYFNENGYSNEIYGRVLNECQRSIEKYQNLLLFSFLKNNIGAKSKVLIIGECDQNVASKIINDYDLYFLKDPEKLSKVIWSVENNESFSFLNSAGEMINFPPLNFFDFIFSFNELEYSKTDLKDFSTFKLNIKQLLSTFGLVLFSFTKYFFKGIHKRHEIVRYLFKNTERYNRFVGYKEMFKDKNLYTESEKNFYFNLNNRSAEVTKLVYNILWEYTPKLSSITKTRPSDSLKNRPAYFFHHLMKCGGTSLVYALHNWFNIIFDHFGAPNGIYSGINDYYKYKLNTDNLVSDTCIVAHFQNDGVFLMQRYPEVLLKPNEYRAFLFVREPMGFMTSLYYYGRKSIKGSLENYLKGHSNYMANLIPCDINNYKEVIDSYFFVGIVERMQESFDKLADIVGKKRIKLPYVNKSEKDDQVSEMSPEFIEKFRQRNKLDYLIYNYCLEKLEKY